VLAAVFQDGYALRYASEALRNDRTMVLFSVAKPMFKGFWWPRLVKTLLQFERDDATFKIAFEPSAIEMQVDEAFLAGGDEVGPQPSSLWLAVTNKKRRRPNPPVSGSQL